MRPGLASALFLGVMLGTSALTFLRVVLVAWQMPVSGFAFYAAITAVGSYLSSILSFGAVEATIKRFPRMVADGFAGDMLPESRRILRVVALRAFTLGIPIFGVGWFAGIEWLRLVGAAFPFALATAYTAIVASMQRAVGDPFRLAGATLLRTVAVLVSVAIAAHSGSLPLLLLTEAGVTWVSSLASVRVFFGYLEAGHHRPIGDSRPAAATFPDGLRVFLAYTLTTMPFYLDRLFVTSVMGGQAAAQYAILAVLPTGASMLINTIAQRVGPDAIRLAHHGQTRDAIRQVLQWVLLTSAMWLIGIGGFALIVHVGMVPPRLQRYAIAPEMLAPIAATGVLLNSALIEFLLIALDLEKPFLRAGAFFVGIVLVCSLLVVKLGLGILGLMWLLALARLAYVAVLLLALPLRGTGNKGIGDDVDKPSP